MRSTWSGRLVVFAAVLLAAGCGGAWAQDAASYGLPLEQASEWTVIVFGARFPESVRAKAMDFTAHATWKVGENAGEAKLSGEVGYLEKTELSLSVPARCSELSVTLDWSDKLVDLDVGLWCAARELRLAPIFTVLKPERVRLDAQTSKLYAWLAKEHPEWWKGYPFWAEVQAAPQSAGGTGE